ncbi:MAG: hypothetical protein JXP34_22330 [Planctomycetes bacterium]|nr:hypothetical protein [Planctomycetota bacterium]
MTAAPEIGIEMTAIERDIAAALSAFVRDVVRQGPGCWAFFLGRSRRRPGSARLAGPWLILQTAPPPRGADPAAIVRTIERGSLLRGGARIVLAADGGIILRADVAVEPDVPVRDRIEGACRGLRQALVILGGRPPASRSIPEASGSAPGGDPLAAVAAACDAGGWPHRRRSGGEVVVDLDVPGVFHQAVVEMGPNGAPLASVVLAPAEALGSPVRRVATATLLAAAAGQVPLVRPAVAAERPALAVGFAADPKPSEIVHALASLSIACGLCGREVASLIDEDLAERFLRIRGWSSDALRAAG